MNFVTQAKVLSIHEHSENIREYLVELEKERKYNPGSFVQLSLDLVTASDIWPDSRTFSIASFSKGTMRFIIKKVGSYTERIFSELLVGKKCTIKYPFGDLFSKHTLYEKHLFIAGGVGITPYFGLIDYFQTNDLLNNVHLLYSVKYQEDILHYKELEKLLGDKLQFFITKGESNGYHTGRISLDDVMNVADFETNIYICGSKSFNSDYKALLTANGYSKILMDEWE